MASFSPPNYYVRLQDLPHQQSFSRSSLVSFNLPQTLYYLGSLTYFLCSIVVHGASIYSQHATLGLARLESFPHVLLELPNNFQCFKLLRDKILLKPSWIILWEDLLGKLCFDYILHPIASLHY